jgi:2-succinyl-5-enolpyruvyl-6-hydroxy-3-cyclohexene-1-carboxylate synthase
MESRWKNINSFWGYLLIEELVRNDITCFCISPGSRSTPLTIAAAENEKAEKIIFFDERAAAFYALGYARAYGKPAAVICTSGTAGANFYPAIIEAKNSQIPLIILTADRPPELRDTGANQTIDQVGMYGKFINWQFDLPCPDTNISAKFLLSTVDQAVHQSGSIPAGPVHLNCMFREPLEPTAQDLPEEYYKSVINWEKLVEPNTIYHAAKRRPADQDLTEITRKINDSKNGLIVVGQLNQISERETVSALAAKLQWPVFADITSGVRNQSQYIPLVPYFDQLFLSDTVIKKLKPDLILHFGRPLTSKRYLKIMEKLSPSCYIQIDPGDARLDPAQLVSQKVCGDIQLICQHLTNHVESHSNPAIEKYLKETTENIDTILDSYCPEENEISEISLARLISQNLTTDQGLFLASSMPVRDFDMYAGSFIKTGNISANRGVSGIDGTLASAIGYASGLKNRVTVVLGDLALLHDLNSLSLVHQIRYPLTIICINNGGGGIFSFLPVAGFNHIFEKYFATAHQYNFHDVSSMFNIAYERPSFNSEFSDIYIKNISSESSMLIEIKTDRKKNYQLHQEIQNKILTTLEK